MRSPVEGRALCITWAVSIDNIILDLSLRVRDKHWAVGSNFMCSVRKQLLRKS